jgi:hypothetical protein
MISENQLIAERLMCNAMKQLATESVHVNAHTYLESMYVPAYYKNIASHSAREVVRTKTPSLVCDGTNARRSGAPTDFQEDAYSDVDDCGRRIRVVDRSMPSQHEIAHYRIPFKHCGACVCDSIAHYPFNNQTKRT